MQAFDFSRPGLTRLDSLLRLSLHKMEIWKAHSELEPICSSLGKSEAQKLFAPFQLYQSLRLLGSLLQVDGDGPQKLYRLRWVVSNQINKLKPLELKSGISSFFLSSFKTVVVVVDGVTVDVVVLVVAVVIVVVVAVVVMVVVVVAFVIVDVEPLLSSLVKRH